MKDKSILLIDLAGSLVVLAIVAAVGWYVWVKPDTATSQMHALSADVVRLQADQNRLESALSAQTARHRSLLEQSDQIGRLPEESPIDQDLKRITSLASDHHIKVLEVLPVSTVRYPNVMEQRYQIKAEGTFAHHVGFMQDYEACSFWSDMTYLRLTQATADSSGLDPMRRSELTVSFFSSYQ